MSRNAEGGWRSLGCAALLAASIAFPAGIFVGWIGPLGERARQPDRPASSAGRTANGRNLYSPRVVTDPYVLEEQRRVLRALEVGCRQLRRHCAEAAQARRRIEEASR